MAYKEYHTSLDNLNNVVSPRGLNGGFNLIKKQSKLLRIMLVSSQGFTVNLKCQKEIYIHL